MEGHVCLNEHQAAGTTLLLDRGPFTRLGLTLLSAADEPGSGRERDSKPRNVFLRRDTGSLLAREIS